MPCRILIILLVLIAGFAYSADIPAPSPDLSKNNSRYIFMPAIDDGGKSSGPHAVTICLPAGYNATDRRYPVFYILDGESAFLTQQNGMRDTIAYEMVADQLVHEGVIDPVIFVAIHNSKDANGKNIPGNRGTDYCITGQTYRQGNSEGSTSKDLPVDKVYVTKSEGYYQYLSQTIKPMIDNSYRTKPEPAYTGVTGFSAGGAGSFWMTYMHPETFGMGICQSAPFRAPYVGKEFAEILYNKTLPMPKVKLWLDAGSREYDFIYKDTFAGYQKLVARGFTPNENIAFYTGHNHGHEKFDCTRRLRAGLYFMLRTKTPKLTSVEINDMDSDAEYSDEINLTRPVHVVTENIYDNWFRLTDANADFKISNNKVVIDNTTNEIRPKSTGQSTISTSINGKKITRKINIHAQKEQNPCYATKNPVVVDGELKEWTKLPVAVNAPINNINATAWKGPADLSYQFDCKYDNNFFYIAIKTTDDYLNSLPTKDPWFQDGIEVRIDARPEEKRLFGQGKEFQDILLIAMSPSQNSETRLPYNADKLPTGTKAICVTTPTGHNTEIAIPISYINEKAGKEWNAIRLNVVVNDLDDDYKGFQGDKLWWQADWRTPDSTWGAGTFIRK